MKYHFLTMEGRRIDITPICLDFSGIFCIVSDVNIPDKLYMITKDRIILENENIIKLANVPTNPQTNPS